MNEVNLLGGVCLFLFSIFYLFFSIRRVKKMKKKDLIRISFYVKIFGGTLILLIIAVIVIYKELIDYI